MIPEKLARNAQCTIQHSKATVQYVLTIKLYYGLRSAKNAHTVNLLGHIPEQMRGIDAPPSVGGSTSQLRVEQMHAESTPFYFFLKPHQTK